MRIYLLNFVLIAFALPVLSQKAIYEGPARWMNDSTALERYEYKTGDSAMIPDGRYELKLMKDFADGGIHELTYFKGNYREGRLEGAVRIFMYNISFNIIEFDSLHVRSEKTGEKMSISGQYSEGQPAGKWNFRYFNMEYPGDSVILQYDTGLKETEYTDGRARSRGRLNDTGFFDGEWEWFFPDGIVMTHVYTGGILTEIRSYPDPEVNVILGREKALLEKADSIVRPPATYKWIATPGGSAVEKAQEPVKLHFIKGVRAYHFAENQMKGLPGFTLPEINGTARIYHTIAEESRQDLYAGVSELQSQDSILSRKTGLPVFELRRDNDPAVDSLLLASEAFLLENEAIAEQLRKFLSDSVRTISPFDFMLEPEKVFSSHEEIVIFLKDRSAGQAQTFEELMKALEEEQEILRVRGTLAELEEEWYYMIQAVETKYRPDSLNSLAAEVFERFLMSDFEERKHTYSEITSLKSRKEFLQNTVRYTRFYYGFFRDSLYRSVQAIPSDLTTAYTRYLYNPYMGVNNVEVIVKKRFLEKILEVFWPYHLTELRSVPTGEDFITKEEETRLLTSMLIHFADRKDTEAKRMERRVRRTKKAEEIGIILREYMENNYLSSTNAAEE